MRSFYISFGLCTVMLISQTTKTGLAPLLQDGRLSSWFCSNQEGYSDFSKDPYKSSEQTYKEASQRSNSTLNPGRMPDSTSAFYQPSMTFSSFYSLLAIPLLSFQKSFCKSQITPRLLVHKHQTAWLCSSENAISIYLKMAISGIS